MFTFLQDILFLEEMLIQTESILVLLPTVGMSRCEVKPSLSVVFPDIHSCSGSIKDVSVDMCSVMNVLTAVCLVVTLSISVQDNITMVTM
ncbi:hypothetical protein JOB18_038932 [Solea senegalensis]|uniref:Uncharacterized protein n=1 Tax=Solea senegalensis TaxID=28829 RepID=A0AAV6S028_SOLSE|nr:hypothetical protein JOB18_038932 [Solea senegalensis]